MTAAETAPANPRDRDLRAQGDRDLFDRLVRTDVVKAALERHGRKDVLGARHHLLGTAVRLTPTMAPELLASMEACREKLAIAQKVETYVYPAAEFNAAAVRPERDLLFVMLSSALLEAFDADELRFVIGHELGHHLFRHYEIPVGALLDGEDRPPPEIALQLYAWKRYAELSSDRAGLVCAGDLAPVASGLFKLASGLRSDRVIVDVDAFLRQVGDLREESERLASAEERVRSDWFSTHPFSPLRLRAAQLFAGSEVVRPGGMAKATLEAHVAELMAVMSPSYLSEASEEAELMRRLLLAGAVLVAAASDGAVTPVERGALERMLGVAGVPTELDVAALAADLPRRIDAVNAHVSPLRRAQVIRDLVVIARAEDHASDAELAVISDIADRIGVGRTVITQACEASAELT